MGTGSNTGKYLSANSINNKFVIRGRFESRIVVRNWLIVGLSDFKEIFQSQGFPQQQLCIMNMDTILTSFMLKVEFDQISMFVMYNYCCGNH